MRSRCPNCKKALLMSASYCPSCGEFIATVEQTLIAAPQRTQVATLDPRQEDSYFLDDDVVSVHAEDARPLTWHKELATSAVQTEIPVLPDTPRPAQQYKTRRIPLTPLPIKGRRSRSTIPPAFFFWTSIITIFVVLLGGIFGVFVTSGHGSTTGTHAPILQASSTNSAIGATLTVHGSNFSPHGRVGLSRDAVITIDDTGGSPFIRADAKGNFTDTITVAPDWQAGIHSINAEDAFLHRIARLSLLVTGLSTSLRPAHLALSTSTLDLGAGDSSTNSTKTLTLGNVGGGQIAWQGSTDQPWLLITPRQGTFSSGTKATVTVAVDRSTLTAGVYTTRVSFLSNAGDSKVTVTMRVLPFDPGHNAVLQLSPAVLAFTAMDGGTRPPTQTITISNPGVRPLQWSATTNAAWLSLSQSTGTIQNASSPDTVSPSFARGITAQNVGVGVDTSTLLPGTYSGMIAFSGQRTEYVKGSPQSIVVTITITPQCGLQVAPSLLTFASVYQQATPADKSITVGVAQGCSTPIHWSAATTSQWLVLGNSSGTTPTSLSVGINTTGLAPATYTGSVVFTTPAGTETVPVTFTLTPQATPIMNVSATTLAYTGVVGQASPISQNSSITNTAGGTLNWQATTATSVGGNWLAITPASGTLTAGQTATVTVAVAQFSTLIPSTYNGTITLTGTDDAGHVAAGSPQVIQVSFTVQAACAVSVGAAGYTFTGVSGQANPNVQDITILASGACAHALAWTATSNAAWMMATPANGVVTLAAAGKGSIGVTLAGLSTGTYHSSLTVTTIDSVTQATIGGPITLPVTLTAQPACTLANPSSRAETFATEAGQNPATQTFTLAVNGTCGGSITITPSISYATGAGWLMVTPASATVASGDTATFTVAVRGTVLTAGTYTSSIALAATANGVAIAGSPQTVNVTANAIAPATLAAVAGKLTANATAGITTQAVNISNTGGTDMIWNAVLANAPAFASLSPVAGILAAGTSTTTNVVVNIGGVTSGTYTANVIITATDAGSGNSVAGSPMTIPITIIVAPAAMQVSTSAVAFTATAGIASVSPATQAIMITNTGGGTLTWTASTPSAAWLTIDTTGGSDAANVSSTLNCSASPTGLTAGVYTATFVLTPSAGVTVTVTATLTVAAPIVTPTPDPTVGVTPTPTAGTTPTPTASATPTPTSNPTPSPTGTPA